jgi:REP element-mobilizing transposase RayT
VPLGRGRGRGTTLTMTEHIYKQHNKSLLMYHLVAPVKYRRKVFTVEKEETLKQICLEIEKRYEIHFIKIGADHDHVHFLVQSVPTMSPTRLVNTIKGIMAKKIFEKHPEIKKDILWGGHFWTAGYYINTVGQFSNEKKNYIKNQKTPSSNYKQIYLNTNQQKLF